MPEQAPVFHRLYVALPPALLEDPDSVAVSRTVVPTVTDVILSPAESLTMVETPGVKKMEELDRARSWDPAVVPSRESNAMW